MKRNGKQPTTLAELQSQRGELAARLGAVGGQLARLDAVADWELASRAYGEQTALQAAVGALDERIEAAQLVERDAQRQEQDAFRQERAASARLALETAARRVCDLVQSFDANELAELEAAQRELALVGGRPDPSAAVALDLARAFDRALVGWRLHAPSWLGLPTPPSARELALTERTEAVALAEQRLTAYRKMRLNSRSDGPTPTVAIVKTMAHGLVDARRSLFALTEPDLDGVPLVNRCYSGINELADDLGEWHERRIDAERKAQREAAGGLLA